MLSREAPNSSPAIIFDLDGTLADTLGDLLAAMNVLLAQIDRPALSADALRAKVGEGLSLLIQRATGVDDPQKLAELVRRYRPLYRARMLDNTRLYPGVPETLDQLTAANARMCVFSNKPDEFTRPICDALLSRWPFVRCLGAGGPVPRKPDPAGALLLAEAMHRLPREVVFVGDSSTDVETAANAGMNFIGVTWGFRDRAHLEAAGARTCIERPVDLAPLLLRPTARP